MSGETEVRIRPPVTGEWAACRMLLPDAFQKRARPLALIAVDERRSTIAGAAVFRSAEQTTYGLRLRVIKPYRRRRIGSRLLQQVIDTARSRGDQRIMTRFDRVAVPEGAAFLARFGFRQLSRLNTVEADLHKLGDWLGLIAARMERRGTVPPSARFVPLRDAPLDQVMQLYVEYIAQDPDHPPPVLREKIRSQALDRSVACIIHGKVEGMLLWTVEPDCVFVHALVAATAYQKASGWLASSLMARSSAQALALGHTRLRFEFVEGNRDMRKLAGRYGASLVKIRERFVLELAGQEHALL